MSREQYIPPSLSQQPGASDGGVAAAGGGSSAGAAATYGGFNITGTGVEDSSRAVKYLCGDCDARVELRKSDPIRCKECGYRVLYKERTNRMIQFEAR